jgi:hypothetical protein
MLAAGQASNCASCHRKAGAGKDYVYRVRRWTTD